MTRWLTTAAVLAALAAPAVAQFAAQKPSYVVIRVKLSDGGGDTKPGTGGGDEGPSYGGGGFIPPGGGGSGGPPGGYQGSGGGPPGFPGGGIPGGGIKPPGQGGGTPPVVLPGERSVHVLIPFDKIYKSPLYPKKNVSEERNPEYVEIKSQFGTSILYPNKVNIQVDFLPYPNEKYRLEQKLSKWAANPNHRPKDLIDDLGDALKAEQLGLAERFADELVKHYEKEENLPADVAAFIKGYKAFKEKATEALPTNPAADTWKAKLGAEATVYTDAPHYAIVHFAGNGLTGVGGDVVTQAADLLEKNFKSFYLWHLKEGYALPLPDKRLAVVITKDGKQLAKLREGLDGLAVASDSFYSPVHNLTVLSPERLDELGRTFKDVSKTKLEGYDPKELLEGKNPALKDKQTPDEIALASTYALVRKALQDEGLRSAISREGSRQLFVSTGFVPQHVRLPRWVESGVGSVLQHPKAGGVVEVTENGKPTPGVVVGVLTGHGAANYELLQQFQAFYPAKKNGNENKSIDASAVLTSVLTDKYFDAVASGNDPDRKFSLPDLPPSGSGGGVKPGGVPPGGGIVPPGGGGGVPPTPPVGPPGGGGGGPKPPTPPGGGIVPPMPPTPPGGGGPGGGGGKDPSPEIQGPRPGGGPGGPPGGGFPGGPVVPGGGPGGPKPGGGGGLEGPDPGSGGPGGLPGGGGGGVLDPGATNPLLTAAQLDQKSKATAWALTFYLTKNGKLPKLYAYLGKLNELPRDMRVDRDVSLKLFCETFGMLKPNSQEVDKEAFDTFAKDWMKFMHDQTPTFETIPLKKFSGPDTGGQPGGGGPKPPGFPGGGGGGPGA